MQQIQLVFNFMYCNCTLVCSMTLWKEKQILRSYARPKTLTPFMHASLFYTLYARLTLRSVMRVMRKEPTFLNYARYPQRAYFLIYSLPLSLSHVRKTQRLGTQQEKRVCFPFFSYTGNIKEFAFSFLVNYIFTSVLKLTITTQ